MVYNVDTHIDTQIIDTVYTVMYFVNYCETRVESILVVRCISSLYVMRLLKCRVSDAISVHMR